MIYKFISSLIKLLVVLLLIAACLLGHEIALLLHLLHWVHSMVAHHATETIGHHLWGRNVWRGRRVETLSTLTRCFEKHLLMRELLLEAELVVASHLILV